MFFIDINQYLDTSETLFHNLNFVHMKLLSLKVKYFNYCLS